MSGCDRCGHPNREHIIQGNQSGNLLCAHPMGRRLCLCPRYIHILRAALSEPLDVERLAEAITNPLGRVRVVELDRLATLRFVEEGDPIEVEAFLAPLRGHDLACWCPLDQPCHADVLLELVS